jgi:hypothetical protein
VVFDEDSFPLAASPSLTDLDFLCESGPTVSTIGLHLTTVGTSPPAPHRPAPEIPPGFEPPVANLPAPTVRPGFLPRTATTVAPPPVTIGPPPHTWPVSPVTYVRQEVGAGAAGTRGTPGATLSREVGARATGTHGTPRAILRWQSEPWGHVAPPELPCDGRQVLEPRRHMVAPRATLSWEAGTTPPSPHLGSSVGGQGVVVPITPPDNPHRMITRGKTGFMLVPDHPVLTVATSSSTPSPIPSFARAALADPH